MARQDGKVFIGGLSWETTDEKLKRYFENYGTVQEAFVSYDRNTGRPRGFGFVVFTDPLIADKVVSQQHTIDRREVEAKKALPKEESPVSKDQQAVATGQRTRKIFVGGLAPSVDEAAMRTYFEEFGGVDDAVVMYDHENRRPRGFGFITFCEEEAVDRVFARGPIQLLHEKQIEIKRAVPRDSMPPSPRGTVFRGQPPYPEARSPYSERNFSRGYAQRERYSPHPHPQGGYGGRGGSMRPMPPMYSPPAVVTGIPASMAAPHGDGTAMVGAAGLPVGGTMSSPMVSMQSPISMQPMQSPISMQPMQSPGQLVGGYALPPNGMQAAAAAAVANAQLAAGTPTAYSLDAQQQAAAAAQNLADLQQQVTLGSVSDALEQLQVHQLEQAAVQQAVHQQQQQAAQQPQAGTTIWS